jgi:predicted transcriptional regulator
VSQKTNITPRVIPLSFQGYTEIMKTQVKTEAARLVAQLPEDATWEDLQYAIYVQQAIEVGIKDAKEGRVYATEEVRKRLDLRFAS